MFVMILFELLCLLIILTDGQSQTPDSTGTQTLFANQQSPNQIVTIDLFFEQSLMQMTYSGPSTVWYGIGFNNTVMSYTYAIVIDGYGNIQERYLGMNSAGMLLQPTVTAISNTTTNDVRTVKLSRKMVINDADYFTFPEEKIQNFSIIFAYGNQAVVSYHQNRSWDTFFMAPPSYYIEYTE
eukprot:514856_1